ncbi:MAG: aminotransferase class I/II-fold pyridoxal phosphate-dependent enzyme [Synergistaceae bacterium]|jgi:threonine-phosphate decarboxylase|nr:aminotransferase class I/II-fold pyridoxal phosphate-dependent enzyme [Synergistaceae bacterium]
MLMIAPHGGNVYDFASREILDFSSNINPAGPPEYAVSSAADAMRLIGRYPDARQAAIRNAFSRWLAVAPDELAFGNGASEMIRAVMTALKLSRVVVTQPTFAEYGDSARALGIPVIGIPSDAAGNFAFDIQGIRKIFSRGDLLVTCQPNNPTGVPWREDELRELASMCSSAGGFMLADECFINLAHPALPSCLGMIGGGNVIVLRAVTKDFAAPGLRVGFIAARADVARAARENLQPWPLNCVGEAFAIACALRPEPYIGDSAKKISALRGVLSPGISALGYAPNPSAANFILVRSDHLGADEIHDRLLEHSILIRKCANFPALDGRYFRAAVRNERDNAALLSGLASIASR